MFVNRGKTTLRFLRKCNLNLPHAWRCGARLIHEALQPPGPPAMPTYYYKLLYVVA